MIRREYVGLITRRFLGGMTQMRKMSLVLKMGIVSCLLGSSYTANAARLDVAPRRAAISAITALSGVNDMGPGGRRKSAFRSIAFV